VRSEATGRAKSGNALAVVIVTRTGRGDQMDQPVGGVESNKDAICREGESSQVEDKVVIGVAELALPVIRQLFQDRPRNLR
jgi:hypothetical protein